MRLATRGQALVRDGTVVTDGERQKAPTPPNDLHMQVLLCGPERQRHGTCAPASAALHGDKDRHLVVPACQSLFGGAACLAFPWPRGLAARAGRDPGMYAGQ